MYAAIRVKGKAQLNPKIRKGLELLRLDRINHCVLVREDKQMRSLLDTTKDIITYGEINAETLSRLLEKRGRLFGDKKIDKEALKRWGFASIEDISKELSDNKREINEITELKPVFRLHPPKKGYERAGVKKQFSVGGAVGYRGEKINDLIQRMI